MRRWLFKFAATVSLALFVVMAVFCIRAQRGSNDYVEFRSKHQLVLPDVPPDRLTWTDAQWVAYRVAFEAWARRQWSVHVRANPNAIFAFGRQPFFGYPASGSFGLHLYYGVGLPALAVLPALVAVRKLRSRRRGRQGRCAKCGYDLRATPERCPECGASPP